MNVRSVALWLSAVGLAPAAAAAQEVTVALAPGVVVPVGPAGTTARVERQTVLGGRYALVRSRGPANRSRCATASERVSAWFLAPTGWTEVANEVFDRCPARRGEPDRVVRARVVEYQDQAELHVVVVDPRQPPNVAPLTRFRRLGDRWLYTRNDAVLASAPGEGAAGALAAAPAGATDGDLAEWAGVAPVARGEGAELWLAARGSTLRFAARVRTREAAPELALTLAEPGASTATMQGARDNGGRALVARCGAPAADDPYATVRCARAGDTTVFEGETDLATMARAAPRFATVAAFAQVRWGAARLATDPNRRAHPYALPAPVDLLDGASPHALARCSTGFRARVPAALLGGADADVLTCGATCRGGWCGPLVVARGLGDRLTWTAPAEGRAPCLVALGLGADEIGTCAGARPETARLVGVVPARGYEVVVVVERTTAGGARRPEVWALVTRSARWQRLWQGAARGPSEVDGAPAATLATEGPRVSVCRGAACERVACVTLAPADERASVTGPVVRALRTANLARRRVEARAAH